MSKLEKSLAAVILFGLGWLTCAILFALLVHLDEPPRESRCVDPTGHFERPCP